ncbi:fatty acid desaturase family protein [Saprospiraceae bacterium]|nr:fatty acid desaturase family protein [Saprospiraceae bacterium]
MINPELRLFDALHQGTINSTSSCGLAKRILSLLLFSVITFKNQLKIIMQATIQKELTGKMDTMEFKSLFKMNSKTHILNMVYNWLIIFVVIYAYHLLSSLWFYIPALLIIGARMHALTILMHDAAHYRFLKNRKWNDLISNVFIMYPLFSSIQKYRANHLKHHQHLNSDMDPDWVAKLTKREFQFPKTKGNFLLTIFSYIIFYQGFLDAVWFLKRYKTSGKKRNPQNRDRYIKLAFYLILFSSLTYFNLWYSYILFWMAPYLSSFFMFQYIRSVAEHFGDLAYEDSLSSTRTVQPNLFEKFFIAPHHVGYHIEHHLFPAIPFYNLPKLHKLLMKQDKYRLNAHITRGYVKGLLQELGK